MGSLRAATLIIGKGKARGGRTGAASATDATLRRRRKPISYAASTKRRMVRTTTTPTSMVTDQMTMEVPPAREVTIRYLA